MNRRRKAAGEASVPAPRREGKLWRAGDGAVRTGWLLAASLFCYALTVFATRYGLVRAFGALFTAWGVDGENIHLAPAWARTLYVWHGSLAAMAFAGLTLRLSAVLRALWRLDKPLLNAPRGRLWPAALAGTGAVVAVAVLGLLPDSVRPEWPLTAPRFTWTLPAMAAVSLASAVAEEAFTKRVLFDGLRGRWGSLWATAVACAVFWLTGGSLASGVIGALNLLLLGAAGCALYARYGLWTSVGFRWGWGLANTFLLGFGGGGAAVYRLYGVSETLLTGGDAGPMRGLWATLVLAGVIAWTRLRHK